MRMELTSGGKRRVLYPEPLAARMRDYHAYLRERGLGYIVDGTEPPMEEEELEERIDELEREVKRLRELRVYRMPTPTPLSNELETKGQGKWS